jgi:hypothetical protein
LHWEIEFRFTLNSAKLGMGEYISGVMDLRPNLTKRFVWELIVHLISLEGRNEKFAYKCERPREAKKTGHKKRKKRVGRFGAFFILKDGKKRN